MKPYRLLVVLITISFAIGCGSGQKVNDRPPHLTEGMEAMQKGIVAYQRGCYRRSLDHFLRAHENFAASDQLAGVAMSMNNIGNVYRFIGDPASARLFFDEAIGIYLSIGDAAGAQQAFSNKAALLIDLNELEEAQDTLRHAENVTKGEKETATLLNNQGVLLIKQKAYAQAEDVLNRGLDLVSTDDLPHYATLNYSLGRLMMATNRWEPARGYFETALQADRQQGFHKGMADDLAALGRIYQAQAQYKTAAAFFQRSIKIYALIENKIQVQATLEQLEEAAAQADVDIRVTQLFVERWLAGKMQDNPCK
jgi:tetratricopeptide (TPR) repeat protein